MRPKLWTGTLAGALVAGMMLVSGSNEAKAQLVVATPGISVGVGVPTVGVYPSYGVVPGYGYAPVYGAYPIARPVPYVYRPAPVYYAPRPYAPVYRGWYGYRRW